MGLAEPICRLMGGCERGWGLLVPIGTREGGCVIGKMAGGWE
jgi:hypothetical protein